MTSRRRPAWFLLGPLAVGACLLGVAPPADPEDPPAIAADRLCAADAQHPLRIDLVPAGAPRPGERWSVRVRVSAQRLVDDVSLDVRPSAGVTLETPVRESLGLLHSGGVNERVLTFRLPADRTRRTVDIVAVGHIDGMPVARGATLNVNYDPEPSRLVVTADGRRIREVQARRVD
jgi:hypothetical protein